MMEHPQQPPAYSHDPATIFLPPVPTSEPASTRPRSLVHLPNLDSLQLPPRTANETTWQAPTTLSHIDFPQVPSGSIGSPAPTELATVGGDFSPSTRPQSVVSMDDPDVRLAAEAMCGLSKSPSTNSRRIVVPPINTQDLNRKREREPLLRLLTTSHPWLGTTISGSLTAYAFTKNYSPQVVRDSAEYIERSLAPVASTVGVVGRRTGMESGIRRYLGEQREHRRPSDLEAQDEGSGKRRRIDKSDSADSERGRQFPSTSRIRNDSTSSYAESLPAYDDYRSPRYEETEPGQQTTATSSVPPDQRVNWSTQLVMTTSGLGAALHKESLEKLKSCMQLLKHFTEQLSNMMASLRRMLDDYEANRRAQQESAGEATADGSIRLPTESSQRIRQLADQMRELGGNIWKMLHHVMQSVIKYTWGALPDNASRVVRGQVLSAPERWRRIQHSDPPNSQSSVPYEATTTHHMLTFAKESLEVMAQVGAVIGGTIDSAEAWLNRMGRTPHEGPVDITEEKKRQQFPPTPPEPRQPPPQYAPQQQPIANSNPQNRLDIDAAKVKIEDLQR